ncbi:O-antigen ligase family protein [Pseudoalteromonas sp. 2CM28B]|uniref:O-antigen ligase family protein n=1 Tax=Pseudoalteromonas sp. 2CM28B TaxID=2929851 RepID=UPI0020BDA945|nr:O-antigen ligase family protein [Pseudoalteromonas sp. 2CM28B]MCK8132658.1 O-antigen ligase family protein [Pseudoalteromonas sp. 2CM28B]
MGKYSAGDINQPSFLHKLCLIMMSLYLLADIASGFFVIQLGIDLKISLLYKLPLTALVFILILSLAPKYFLALCCILTTLLLGPVLQLLSKANFTFFVADFSYVYKMLMPISIFIYFGLLAARWRRFTIFWLEKILLSNFIILCFNLFIGALGFGRASYSLQDGETAGSNGFIYAANELGGAMVVLFSFALHWCWNEKPKWYFIFSLFTVLCGLLVATKTAMLAALMLIFLIPIANEREKIFSITKLKCIIFIPMIAVVVAIFFLITDLLQAIGLYDRLAHILSEQGILGVIWSGRDEYVRDLLTVYIDRLDFWQQLVGVGTSGVAQYIPRKYTSEVDLIDALVWFGLPGVATCLGFYVLTLLKAASQFVNPNSKYSPSVFVGLFILFFLAQLSGHIWMSGTLGIVLGCFLSLLWVDNKKESKFEK